MRPDDSPASVLEPISRRDGRFDAYQQSLMATSYENGLFNMSSLAQHVNRTLEAEMDNLRYGESIWDKYDRHAINDLLQKGYGAARDARGKARDLDAAHLIDRPQGWLSDAEKTRLGGARVDLLRRNGLHSEIYETHLGVTEPQSVRKMAQVSRVPAAAAAAAAAVPVPAPVPVAVVDNAPMEISAAARAAAYGDRTVKEPEPKKKKSIKPSKNKDKDKGKSAEGAADWMQ